MRIVGGKLRGRTLAAPKSITIRPTTDRVRESLFNILEHGYSESLDGGRVLDVFAGTGALGCEALSRGARFALFIESGTEGRALLRQNVDTLGLADCTRIFKRDAIRPGPCPDNKPFGLVFADPPYGKKLAEKALKTLAGQGWLADQALLVVEEEKLSLPNDLEHFVCLERRDFGDTAVGIFRYTGGNNK